ncbi:MAG TPA: prenyltransferase/squalene oxidase repeat-containing protein [Conexivisphaerales archaeon]|nr:prenyltransferase/squalene oxidase repeat-containing protein [Conexivisphaerales archaeon]
MAGDWTDALKFDPTVPLLGSDNEALSSLARRDLMGEHLRTDRLWALPPASHLVDRQGPDGSWRYRGGNPEIRTEEDYNQIETFRSFGELVEKYAFDVHHPSARRACEFLLAHQTAEGDIRGILGRQYAPYYTAAMMELMIKAGYGDDPRISRGFSWLSSMRQDDGGWALPIRTRALKLDEAWMKTEAVEPLRSRPFSHLITGMVLRAYAAHPMQRKSAVALGAAKLLCSRILERDAYTDRGDPGFWTRFSFPFWFTDLVSALDSLSLLGVSPEEPGVAKGLAWLRGHQRADGTWEVRIVRGRDKDSRLWVSFAASRAIKRFYRIGEP